MASGSIPAMQMPPSNVFGNNFGLDIPSAELRNAGAPLTTAQPMQSIQLQVPVMNMPNIGGILGQGFQPMEGLQSFPQPILGADGIPQMPSLAVPAPLQVAPPAIDLSQIVANNATNLAFYPESTLEQEDKVEPVAAILSPKCEEPKSAEPDTAQEEEEAQELAPKKTRDAQVVKKIKESKSKCLGCLWSRNKNNDKACISISIIFYNGNLLVIINKVLWFHFKKPFSFFIKTFLTVNTCFVGDNQQRVLILIQQNFVTNWFFT